MVHVDYLMAPVNSRRVRTRTEERRGNEKVAFARSLKSPRTARLFSSLPPLVELDVCSSLKIDARLRRISVNQFELIIEAFETNLRGEKIFSKQRIFPITPWLYTIESIDR